MPLWRACWESAKPEKAPITLYWREAMVGRRYVVGGGTLRRPREVTGETCTELVMRAGVRARVVLEPGRVLGEGSGSKTGLREGGAGRVMRGVCGEAVERQLRSVGDD